MLKRASNGFTLIELLVAMVLLGLALGLFVPTIVGAFHSNRTSADAHTAKVALTTAIGLVESDIRTARAPDRRVLTTSGLDDLRIAVQTGSTMSGLDIRDVVKATPTELWVRANAVTEPAGQPIQVECVGYVADPARGLQRTIGASASTCPAPSGSTSTLLPPVPSALATGPVFTYHLLVNPTAGTANFDPRASCLAPETSTIGTAAIQLNQISSVTADLRSFVDSGSTYGDDETVATVGLRTRAGGDYLYALGCELT